MSKQTSGRPIVSVTELAEHVDDPDWIVVDCRFNLMDAGAGHSAWLAGHIPGAFYADLDKDLAAPAAADGAGGRHPLPEPASPQRLFRSWGMHAGSRVVVYDDVGNAIAARLWWLLRWFGQQNCAVLDGGFPAWEAGGYPISAEAPVGSEGSIDATPGAMPVTDADAVAAGLAANRLVLLDARAAGRFAGHEEPLDKCAGHVPGAVNTPFQENLRTDKCFRGPEDIEAYYRAAIGHASITEVACMCGSGVTACHTLLALELAGMPGASLYVGSWSDWISDAARRVGTANDDET